MLQESEAASEIANALLEGDTLTVASIILQTLPSSLTAEEAAEIAATVATMLVSEPVV